jgi:CRISPR-associated endonuclease/helicase Cas3
MCPAHRTGVLGDLKRLLEEQTSAAPILCVSTQLIEAGVDIDFGVVIRDIAGLDSVAQAAGRCNRHNRRPEGGRVHIVKLRDLPKTLKDISIGQEAAERVLGEWRREHMGDPFPLDDPAQMRSFFEYYFFERAEEMRYPVSNGKFGREATLLELLGANGQARCETSAAGVVMQRDILCQSFKAAAESFAAIDGATEGIVVPFEATGRKIVNDLCSAHDLAAEWQLLRKAQQYTVSVFEHVRGKLFEAGAVYEASPGTGIYCLRPEFYDPEFGLRPEGGSLETMIE